MRESLLSRQKVLEHKEKSRKLRELKKYGKKVQYYRSFGEPLSLPLLVLIRFSKRYYKREKKRRKQHWML